MLEFGYKLSLVMVSVKTEFKHRFKLSYPELWFKTGFCVQNMLYVYLFDPKDTVTQTAVIQQIEELQHPEPFISQKSTECQLEATCTLWRCKLALSP